MGKAEEARTALAKPVRKIIATKMPNLDKGQQFAGDWVDWLHCQILCHEAEASLNKGTEAGIRSQVGSNQAESRPLRRDS